MKSLKLWKLSSQFTVKQAALLILGLDPADHEDVERWTVDLQPDGYFAVTTALINAIQEGSLKTKIVSMHGEVGLGVNAKPTYEIETKDWKSVVISRSEISKWLSERNFKDGFFVEEGRVDDDFMDSASEFYAPKLAACFSALRAIKDDPSLLNGKTPKQAIKKFLRENADQFGLTKEDGSPNEKGIEEICKVANWSPEGGVARTRTQVLTN